MRVCFSVMRSLLQDTKVKADFSNESEAEESDTCKFRPEDQERFMGRMLDQIGMPDGGRIIRLRHWDKNDPDLPLHTENHNIFRLDSENKILWQITRVEDRYVNWEARNKHAKEDDPSCEGYLDPFLSMGSQFFERRPLPYKGPYHPTFEIVLFDEYKPGRLLGARTNWWGYDIDPETGVATCNGRQQK